jgi:hypothetical protein
LSKRLGICAAISGGCHASHNAIRASACSRRHQLRVARGVERLGPRELDCVRLENGFKTTQGDCSNFGSAMGIKQPAQRYPYTDLEAGITAGFVLFAGADIDFHMFKMIDGKIPWINAVVGPAVTSSGWPAK